MSSREAAIAKIVEIARQHAISAGDIEQALGDAPAAENGAGSGIVRRLLAYVGGIFVFAGIAVYIGMFWEEMNSAARIIVTLGSGSTALIIALLLLGRDALSRAATPLLLMAGWLQPLGILVAFEELGAGGDPQHALLAATATMLAQQLLVFWRHPRPTLLFLALAFGTLSLWNALDLLGLDGDLNTLLNGLSLLLLSHGINSTAHRVITPFWYFLGGAGLLWAAFDLLEHTPLHLAYLGLCAFMIYISTLAGSRSLLFVSTLAMMGYLGYFTAEYFVDSIGWPIALIFMGLVLIGLSNMALRISREYMTEA